MSLRAQQLQAALARRREVELQRIERTAAINQYYDHWGKVTSRYQNWTTPEYYKQADEKFKNLKQKKEKEKTLEVRRSKLRDLFGSEKSKMDLELKEYERPKSKKRFINTETLEKIEQNARERENIRRKLELEAKLYGRWRHGVDDENLIFESKSDHEVLAKLNWLDKQVENQVAREKEEANAQERNLRLQTEINKSEQLQKERQQIREQEIKEIRALQDSHMDQLKERQRETEELKEKESKIREQMSDIEKELDLLVDSSALVMEPAELSTAYNLNKIKVFIKKRSEVFCNQIKLLISMLERVKDYASNKDELKTLLKKYKEQQESEGIMLTQIESMYESEAKVSLQACEEAWQSQHLERYHDVQQLLKGIQCLLSARLNENLKRQEDLIELRSTHLTSIENSNEKLKQLIKEHADSPRSLYADTLRDEESSAADVKRTTSNTSLKDPSIKTSKRFMPKVSNSFANLNLNAWEELPSARGSIADSTRERHKDILPTESTDTLQEPSIKGSKRQLPKATSSFVNLNFNAGEDLPSARGSIAASTPENQKDVKATTSASTMQEPSPSLKTSKRFLPKVTNSFANLNLDAGEDLPSARGSIAETAIESQRSLNVVSPDSFERPRFARKRVAWT